MIHNYKIKYLGAIAAALLLLAWSVDNLLQKEIRAISQAMNQAERVKLQVEFQTSVLHDIADLRDDVRNYILKGNEKYFAKNGVPIEFQDLNAGRMMRMLQLTNRMEDFRLAAELCQSVFRGVDIPDDISQELNNAVKFFQKTSSDLIAKHGEAQDFLLQVRNRKFGAEIPGGIYNVIPGSLPRPTQQDMQYFDKKVSEFWKLNEISAVDSEYYQRKLYEQFYKGVNYISSRHDRYVVGSNIISISYVVIFFIGSILSIIASLVKTKKKGADLFF